MIKFIKRNKIISAFGAISILISVSYAITYNMPDYFGIESWYSLFNNISISYIAALIFYILQVYEPDCEKSKQAQIILWPLFSELVEFIELSIACCRKYVSTAEGTIAIDWNNKEEKVIYFVPIIEGENSGHRPAIRKSASDMKTIGNDYRLKIKEIKERISFRDCNSDILNALSKLESSDFLKTTLPAVLMFEGTFIKFPDFQKSVDEFELIKDDFKKCCGITHKYEIRDAEDMEIATSEAIFLKKALQATSVDDFNEIVIREHFRQKLKPLVPDEKQLETLITNALPAFFDAAKKKT